METGWWYTPIALWDLATAIPLIATYDQEQFLTLSSYLYLHFIDLDSPLLF